MDNGSAPATKKDLHDLESRLEGKMDASEQRVLDKVRTWIHDSETRLLGAFYTFAESNQQRLSAIELENSGVKARLATLEDRITNVEKRLNMPPQQAS